MPDRPAAPGPGQSSQASTASPASTVSTAEFRRSLAVVDAMADHYQRRGGQPGLAYGIVAGGCWCTPGGSASAGSVARRRTRTRSSGLPR